MGEQASGYYDYIAWNGRAPRPAPPVPAAEPAAIDTTTIRLGTERELRYWTGELCVTIYTLRDAIAATGSRCADVVRAYLDQLGKP